MGKKYEANESLFMTPHGVYTTRTIKRLPIDQQSDANFLKAGVGVPWDMQEKARPGRKPKARPIAIVPDNMGAMSGENPRDAGDHAPGNVSRLAYASDDEPDEPEIYKVPFPDNI